MSRLVLALSVVSLLVPSARSAEPLDLEQTRSAVAAARDRLTPTAGTAEPFRISARLRFPFDAKAPEGRLQQVWAGRLRVRSEWALPGWRQLEIRDGATVWSWLGEDNAAAMIPVSEQVELLLQPNRLLTFGVETPGSRELIDGRELVRVQLGAEGSAGSVAWIDPANAELVALEEGNRRYDFGGGSEAGGRHWPRVIRVSVDGSPFLSASFGKPESGSEVVPAELFVPPAGARKAASAATADLIPPRLLEAPPAIYPERSRREGIAGTVIVRAIIGTDGRVSEVEVLDGASRPLQQAALESVRKRVYSPGLLDGEPVDVVSTIRVVFELEDREIHQLGVRPRSAGAH